MQLTKQDVHDVLDVYIQAWTGQNPDLIVSIFTDAATYHERAFDAPISGREAIRAYWETKVVKAQGNIQCELLDLYLDGTTAVAEWEAEFDDVPQQVRKRMREVAIIKFTDGPLIEHLREYWSSQVVPELP